MTPRFIHPLWTHIPALLALLVFIAMLVTAGPLPSDAPIHFGENGRPDAYGSPAGVFVLLIAMSIGFIALSVWLDELWARQEHRKTFNWFSLLDEVTIASMAGLGAAYLGVLNQADPVFAFSTPVEEFLAFVLPATGAAIILERLRPFVPGETHVPLEDTAHLEKELERRIRRGDAFVYADLQNPVYFNIIALVVPAVLFISAFFLAPSEPLWATALKIGLGIFLALLYGGMRTMVTRDRITVRFGTPGLRVLSLLTSEVKGVTLRPYSPLAEFGGYGIRRNRHMKGYFLRGGTGVLIETESGGRYLVGSDHPGRLADVISVAAGLYSTQ